MGRANQLILDVTTDCSVYRVGSPIMVRVQAVARRSCQIQGGAVGLVAELWSGQAKEVSRFLYGGVSTASLQNIIERPTLARSELAMTGPLSSGASMTEEALLPGPALGPSCEGFLSFRVVVDVVLADGRIVRAGVPVHMVSPRSLYAQLEGVTRGSGSWGAVEAAFGVGGPRRTSGVTGRTTKGSLQRMEELRQAPEKPEAGPFQGCAMELLIPRASARPGEVVPGTLRVRPLRPVLVKQLHVALRHKKIGRGWSDHSGFNYTVKVPPSPILQEDSCPKVVLAKQLQLTEPLDFPFTVQVPVDGPPTLLTSRCSSRWCVIGYLRQRGLGIPADHVIQEINVYTGE